MAEVRLSHIKKNYGKVIIVKDFDLTIYDKKFMVFVGPSGCGKSTTLRMVTHGRRAGRNLGRRPLYWFTTRQ